MCALSGAGWGMFDIRAMPFCLHSPRRHRTQSVLCLLSCQGAPWTPVFLRVFTCRKRDKGMNPEEYKSVRIGIRMAPPEYERLKHEASLAGISVSEFVRRRIFGRPIIPATDLIMVRELRRLGGLFKHSLVVSKGAYKSEVSQAMASIRNFIDKLANDF